MGLIGTPIDRERGREVLSFLTGLTLSHLETVSRQLGGTSQGDPATEIPVLGSALTTDLRLPNLLQDTWQPGGTGNGILPKQPSSGRNSPVPY